MTIRPSTRSKLLLGGFCDADWASDPDDKMSTSRFCIYLGSNPVSWQSKKQHIFEVEDWSWIPKPRTFGCWGYLDFKLIELELPLLQTPLVWCDSVSTFLLFANLVKHARAKHMLDLYFVREKVLQGSLIAKHVPSSDQVVGILTKSIPPQSSTN